MKHVRVATVTFMLIALMVGMGAPLAHASHTDNSGWASAARAERKAKKFGSKIVKELPVPVIGVSVQSLIDTWGEARTGGRTHEGIDIIAPRGSIVVSPTKAIVIRVGKDTLGGNVVYTANPGGERFYYAHLDSARKGLKVGQELKVGDVIGYVGNTGNASAASPHLHLGIYKKGAHNPFPRITKELKKDMQKEILTRELMKKRTELAKGK